MDASILKHCQLQITNQLTELRKMQATLEQFFQQHQLSEALAGEMMLVAEELLVNTINYGYSDDLEHTINIVLTLNQQTFSMTFSDDAMAFNPLKSSPSCTETIGGHGIPLVRALCDEHDYQRNDGCNVFVLSKLIV